MSRHNLVRLQRRRQSDNNRKTCNKNAVIKLTRCTARYTLTNNNRYIYNYNNVLCIYVYKVLNAMQHGENQLSLGQIIVVALHKFYTCLKCVCCAVSRLCKLNKTKIQQKITFTLLHTCILLITKQNAIMLCVGTNRGGGGGGDGFVRSDYFSFRSFVLCVSSQAPHGRPNSRVLYG